MQNPTDVQARDIVVIKRGKDTYHYYLVDFASPECEYFGGYRIHLGGDWYKCKEFYIDKSIMQGKYVRNTGGWVNLFTGRASISKEVIIEKTGTLDESRYAELLYYYVMIASGNYTVEDGVFRVVQRPLFLHVPFSTMIESAMNLTREGFGVVVTPEVHAVPQAIRPSADMVPPSYLFRGIQVTDEKKNYASMVPMQEGEVIGEEQPDEAPKPDPDPPAQKPTGPAYASIDIDKLKKDWKACKSDDERINLVFERCSDEEGRLPIAETYGCLFTRYDGKSMKKPLPNSVMLPRKHFDIIAKCTSQRAVIVYDYPRQSGESKRLSPSAMKTTIERVKSIAGGKDMVL